MATEPPRFTPPEPHTEPSEPAPSSVAWAPPHAPVDSHWVSAQQQAMSRESWSTGRRWALGLGIAAAVAGTIAGVVGGSVALGSVIAAWVEEGAPIDAGYVAPGTKPLLEGDSGHPEVVVATECDGPCFSAIHIDAAQIDASAFERLGTPELFEPQGTYGTTDSALEHEYTLDAWREGEGTPDSCFFSYTIAPLAYEADDRPSNDDTIYFLSSFASEDEFSLVTRSVRIFESNDDAREHLRALHQTVPDCTDYAVGTGMNQWAATVTPMPALTLPETVAGVGWVESGTYSGRYYAVDLLRGNVVVRTTLNTDGQISEQAFRDFAEYVADDMASWQPNP